MVDQTQRERVLANIAESQAARRASKPDAATRQFNRMQHSLSGGKSRESNEERFLITRRQFNQYQKEFFGRLSKIQKTLEIMVKSRSEEKRVAVESDVEEKQSRPGEPQREERSSLGLRRRPGLAAGLAFIVGVIISNIERVITFFREGFQQIRLWVEERIQSVVDFVNNVVGSVVGAARGAVRMAPLAAAGPLAMPAIGAAVGAGVVRSPTEGEPSTVREPTVPTRSPEPEIARTTSMPAPRGIERQRIPTRGGAAPGVRAGSDRQRRMIELARDMGYTVTSGERNWGAGGHQGGFAIDLRPRGGQGTEPSREDLVDIWSRFRQEFNMPVDVLYEPHGHGRSTGNHIHVEVHPTRANDSIRFGSQRVRAPTTPTIQEPPSTTPEQAPVVPRTFPRSLEKSAEEYDTDIKQVVVKHPPQVITENKVMDSPRRTEYAPRHVDLVVRNPFDGIIKIRNEASVEKW